MGEPEDKGYTVEDRRYLHLSEEEKAKVRAEAAKRTTKDAAAEEAFQEAAQKATAAAGQPEERGARLPEITFASLLVSLSSTAFAGLGAVPDPESGKTEKNLPLAKQTIDLLGLLREKTRNNLTLEEENLFDHLLYDLRMAYVREVG